MKKCLSLLLMAIIVCAEISAQNLPNSIFVGSVNVKIDGDARSIIEREIDNLNANPKYLNSLVTKMNLYFPIIEKVLAEEGVPDEFKYLCVQESAFNAEAVSTSNAVGFWQFKKLECELMAWLMNVSILPLPQKGQPFICQGVI